MAELMTDAEAAGVIAEVERTVGYVPLRLGQRLASYASQVPALKAENARLKAVVVKMELRFYDDWLSNFHPDDTALKAECERVHGKRIAKLRAALQPQPETP